MARVWDIIIKGRHLHLAGSALKIEAVTSAIPPIMHEHPILSRTAHISVSQFHQASNLEDLVTVVAGAVMGMVTLDIAVRVVVATRDIASMAIHRDIRQR